jgi:hypothetical protein
MSNDKETKGIASMFIDTEQLNKPPTQEEKEISQIRHSSFVTRFQYVPLYVFGLLLYWLTAITIESIFADDDVIVYAFIPSVPIVLLIFLLKNKIKNRWLFHSLLALFGAPIWILLLTPFIMMFVAFALF